MHDDFGHIAATSESGYAVVTAGRAFIVLRGLRYSGGRNQWEAPSGKTFRSGVEAVAWLREQAALEVTEAAVKAGILKCACGGGMDVHADCEAHGKGGA